MVSVNGRYDMTRCDGGGRRLTKVKIPCHIPLSVEEEEEELNRESSNLTRRFVSCCGDLYVMLS